MANICWFVVIVAIIVFIIGYMTSFTSEAGSILLYIIGFFILIVAFVIFAKRRGR